MRYGDVEIKNLPAEGSFVSIGQYRYLEIANYGDDPDDTKTVRLDLKSSSYGPYGSVTSGYFAVAPLSATRIDLFELLKDLFVLTPPLLTGDEQQMNNNVQHIALTVTIGTQSWSPLNFFMTNNRLTQIRQDWMYHESFFTFQPWERDVYSNDIEVLTCLNSSDVTRKLYCDAANSAGERQTIEYTEIRIGLINLIISIPAAVRKFTIKNISKLYFYLEGSDEGFPQGQNFNILPLWAPSDSRTFYFENTMGGIDRIRVTGKIGDKNKIKSVIAERENNLVDYRVDNVESVTVNSGALPGRNMKLLVREFLKSRNRYVYENGMLRRIVISDSTAEDTRLDLTSFSFEYRYADDINSYPSRFDNYLNPPDDQLQTVLVPSVIDQRISPNEFFFRLKRNGNYIPFSSMPLTVKIPDNIWNSVTDPAWKYKDEGISFTFSGINDSSLISTAKGIMTIYDPEKQENYSAFLSIIRDIFIGLSQTNITLDTINQGQQINYVGYYSDNYIFPEDDYPEVAIDASIEPYIVAHAYREYLYLQKVAYNTGPLVGNVTLKYRDVTATIKVSLTPDAYGIEWDSSISATACTRIGPPELHVSLPIQSGMRRCLLLDDGTVRYYLDPNDSTKRADGTPAILDGTHGQVMVEIPAHYRKFETEGTISRCLISPYSFPGAHFVPPCYRSAYEAAIDRTISSAPKLASVVNTTSAFRGGSNTVDWDGTYRSLLGMPGSLTSLTNFRDYARRRGVAGKNGAGWNCDVYDIQKTCYWLYAIEYANFNCQLDFNPDTTNEGYKQGGLGEGVTNLVNTAWNTYNANNPFIPCGYTNGLGNKSGVVTFDMPPEFGTLITSVPSYRGLENPFGHIWVWEDGCICRVQSDDAGGGSEFYVCSDPDKFGSKDYTDYDLRGVLSRTLGYIRSIIFGDNGDIMANMVGGNSTVYFADYFFTAIPIQNEEQRVVSLGGHAANGVVAGLICTFTNQADTFRGANYGSRLCFIPE